jgi:hypothetical protein
LLYRALLDGHFGVQAFSGQRQVAATLRPAGDSAEYRGVRVELLAPIHITTTAHWSQLEVHDLAGGIEPSEAVHAGNVAGPQVDRLRVGDGLRHADRCAFPARRRQGHHDAAREEREHDHRYDDDATHKAIIS